MKKGMFGIYRINEHRKIEVTPVNGYILDYGVFRFGIRKQWNQWSVTELSTGMLTGIYTSRKKDIKPQKKGKNDMLKKNYMVQAPGVMGYTIQKLTYKQVITLRLKGYTVEE